MRGEETQMTALLHQCELTHHLHGVAPKRRKAMGTQAPLVLYWKSVCKFQARNVSPMSFTKKIKKKLPIPLFKSY